MAKKFAVFALLVMCILGLFAVKKKKNAPLEEALVQAIVVQEAPAKENEVPIGDKTAELFYGNSPFVMPVTYQSRVDWKKGPVWIVDYARHFKTSTHFISRSLAGGPDYRFDTVSNGVRFNVLKPEKDIHFYMIVDATRLLLFLYASDEETAYREHIKTYRVGLGKKSEQSASKSLTPYGIYSLGERVAAYREDSTGLYKNQTVKMVEVFGTRWIPFESEITKTTAPAKGLGLHGAPWVLTQGRYLEMRSSIGAYESDGCIRLAQEDIEELYAIIVSRPATIEIVDDFFHSELAEKVR